MKFLIAFTLFFAAVIGAFTEQEYRERFTSWMQKYQKSFHHEEFKQRYQIFKDNLDWIHSFQAEEHTFTVAMNKFGDLTSEEFSKYYTGLKMPSTMPVATFNPDPNAQLPDSKDWRKEGAVTGVKNQGQCGSCWSFSTTGSTEGCHQISTGNLVSLSEQNLMDCSTSYGNEGCNGGLMTQAMQYIIDNQGIDTEQSYPYTAQDGTCHYQASNSGATLSSYKNVPQGDEDALQQSVNVGPTSVAIDASQSSFQFYQSGVYYEPNCSSQQLDHGVLAVGWGVDSSSNQAYWIVKNSWGTDWGIQGYIWMSRNKDNNCGIATMATLPQC